ncbi:hypothetical protein [Streptomyces hyaluromycini]|uniref:hypothetical protein n=1 Tax=Streptomyces hyaluromycini TaxID=1377993 RepID=UPI000B5CF935|nr:hypothetical protein [Streptomyces hyaluromycini]
MGGPAPRGGCHLPVEATSFVDRRDEQAAGRELLAKARLGTFTGRGAPREGRCRLDRALEASPGQTVGRARALRGSALLAGSPGDLTRGLRRAREARALAERLGGPAEAAHADHVIGAGRLFADDPGAARAHHATTLARGPIPGRHLGPHGPDLAGLARRTAEGHAERILGTPAFSNRSQIAARVTTARR